MLPDSPYTDRGIVFYFDDKIITVSTVKRLFYYDMEAYEEYIAETREIHELYPNEPNVIYIRGGFLRADVMTSYARHMAIVSRQRAAAQLKEMKRYFMKELEEGRVMKFNLNMYDKVPEIKPETVAAFKRFAKIKKGIWMRQQGKKKGSKKELERRVNAKKSAAERAKVKEHIRELKHKPPLKKKRKSMFKKKKDEGSE